MDHKVTNFNGIEHLSILIISVPTAFSLKGKNDSTKDHNFNISEGIIASIFDMKS